MKQRRDWSFKEREVKEQSRNEEEKNNKEERQMKQVYFLKNQKGMGTVEMILILVVLVGLVLIFREKITELLNTVFEQLFQEILTL